MLRFQLKVLVVVALLAGAAQDAQAFGHCGWGGRGWGGCGWGCRGGMWGGGYGYAGLGYGGWGYGGWGYGRGLGYGGWGLGPGIGYGTGLGWGLGSYGRPSAAILLAGRSAAPDGSIDRDDASLTVAVPADARLFVNGRSTTSGGSQRSFVSRDLQPGAKYDYTVRAEFTRNGKPVTEERTVRLAAGDSRSIDFTSAPAVQTAADEETRTTLVVRLPADARLYLAGRETSASGPVREFSTTALPAGSSWSDYPIRAVVGENGREVVRERKVTLGAGETRELSLDFGAGGVERVADAAAR